MVWRQNGSLRVFHRRRVVSRDDRRDTVFVPSCGTPGEVVTPRWKRTSLRTGYKERRFPPSTVASWDLKENALVRKLGGIDNAEGLCHEKIAQMFSLAARSLGIAPRCYYACAMYWARLWYHFGFVECSRSWDVLEKRTKSIHMN